MDPILEALASIQPVTCASFVQVGSQLLDYIDSQDLAKRTNHEEKKLLFRFCSLFSQLKSRVGSPASQDFVIAIAVWAEMLMVLADTFQVPYLQKGIEVCEELLDANVGRSVVLRTLGCLLSSQALLAYKTSLSMQTEVVELVNASSTYFAESLEMVASAVTYSAWARALMRVCGTTLVFDELCGHTKDIGEYFSVSMRMDSSLPNLTKCLTQWAKHVDFMSIAFASSRKFNKMKRTKCMNLDIISTYVQSVRHYARDNAISLQHIFKVACRQEHAQARPLICVIEVLDMLQEESSVDLVREEAASLLNAIKDHFKLVAERKVREKEIYDKLLTELPPDIVASIHESKLELWEIYQNYTTFLRCLYWNSFAHHRLPCFRDVRRKNDAGTDYHATMTTQDIELLFKSDSPKKHYTDFEFIGSGHFSDVFVANKDKAHYAVKTLKQKFTTQELLRNCLLNEILVLKQLQHSHVIYFCEVYLDEGEVSIVTEFCEGGSLEELMSATGRLTEDIIAFILNQLCRGLQCMHNHRIIHRDLKPANVMFKRDGSLKICDLGFAEVLNGHEDQKLLMVGTSRWMAPEVLSGLFYHLAVDIWAVGCIAYEMAQGNMVYEDVGTLNCTFTVATIGAPYLSAKTGKDGVELTWTDLFESFLDSCFQRNSAMRANVHQLLGHGFLCKKYPEFKAQKLVKHLFYSKVSSALVNDELW